MSTQARYFENNLQPIDITEEGLRSSLKDIQAHISDAVELIVHHVENSPLQDDRHESIYIHRKCWCAPVFPYRTHKVEYT